MPTDAWFLGVESLVFGRAAMGEVVEQASLRDVIRVRRGGRLLLHDAIRLDGEVAATLQRPAIAGGARAVATIGACGAAMPRRRWMRCAPRCAGSGDAVPAPGMAC